MQEKRKIAVLVGDGMGDEPVEALGGKTPLQVAGMPDMRRVVGSSDEIADEIGRYLG